MNNSVRKNKAILFADLHASTKQLENLYEIIIHDSNVKLILCAGDIVNMGEPVWFMEKFIKMIDDCKLPFVWAPGNNDFGRSFYKLNAKYNSVEGRIMEECGQRFTGVGGSPASWSGQYAGASMIDRKKIGGTIFISHFPPPGVLNLTKGDLNSPTSTRKFSDSPLVHICGHLHYRVGTAYLGQTKVIQLASLETGHYAIMDLNDLSVEFMRTKGKEL